MSWLLQSWLTSWVETERPGRTGTWEASWPSDTNVGNVASSYGMGIKYLNPVSMHRNVQGWWLPYSKVQYGYVSPAEMSYRGKGVQVGQEHCQSWGSGPCHLECLQLVSVQEIIPALPLILVPFHQLGPKMHLPKLQELQRHQASAWEVNFPSHRIIGISLPKSFPGAHQFT